MAAKPKVAIVCDWLMGTGGAERVVLELHRMYPEAPIYTSQYDRSPELWYHDDWFGDADVRTTWLQRLPKGLKKFLPVLRAWTFSRLDLSQYDLVISCSGAEAKGVRTGKNTLHVNYCHAPTHYYWSRYDQYLKHPGFGRLDWLARWGLRTLVGPLRQWDRQASKRPDIMVAISVHTQEQIRKYYRRDSVVVHPPVDLRRFKPAKPVQRHGFVTVGRQTPYKRIDLAVAACSELKMPLIVIGTGPEHKKLIKMAGRSVTFLTNVSDDQIAAHFHSSLGFIFPTNVEDFGVTGVEALAAGIPVIAYAKGGPRDYIVPGKTGEFFDRQTVESLKSVLHNFKPERYKQDVLTAKAAEFAPAVFRERLQAVVTDALAAREA
ncbi:MAG TPA: glycosyltransferase [Candidatus Saccharimonadales bacterium]|nr:glycosyltransferase [Candidatus Saccharimonadales bacterium]